MADANMDMDIDFDLIEAEDAETARLQAELAKFQEQPNDTTEAMNGVEEEAEEGEVDENAPEVSKVHLRGVDTFNSDHVRAFAEEHYPGALLAKLQWVDDGSVNLVYDSEHAAEEALQAFSADEQSDSLLLRRAKAFSSLPDVELYVRQAVVSDVKVKGARHNSAYYLNNPEHDPELRRLKWEHGQRTYRDRGYAQKIEQKRKRQDAGNDVDAPGKDVTLSVDLYDDNPKALATATERRQSYSPGSEYGRKRLRYQDDAMASRRDGRLRDRSASPTREGDGRYGFTEEQPRRRTPRPRSPPPELARRSPDSYVPRDNKRKELFPGRTTASSRTALTSSYGSANTELFPAHTSTSRSRELFPDHRRQEANDLDMDYSNSRVKLVTEQMRRSSINTMDREYGQYDQQSTYTFRPTDQSARNGDKKPRDLFERIANSKPRDLFEKGRPAVESSYGRLQDTQISQPSNANDGAGFSFKGAGNVAGAGGFSILGASKGRSDHPLAKELFPLKSGASNNGRVIGRGSQGRRTGDLFDKDESYGRLK
ncbi:hypothetical protein B0A50_04493 [Salinomyces thailandicus]|uniref:Uncharacterized protein n=1 Tax=Salinomyces thailandicus TaxID=706561 RepID=A0A4U0TYN5_9PEZI|nr:hypothetical protein B0A50_04493 [Salinomyces thailandica]